MSYDASPFVTLTTFIALMPSTSIISGADDLTAVSATVTVNERNMSVDQTLFTRADVANVTAPDEDASVPFAIATIDMRDMFAVLTTPDAVV